MTQQTRWQPAHPAGPRAGAALRRTGRRAGRAGRQRCERGSVSLELAALAPVLLLLVLVTVAAMRITLAGAQVDGAARDAARAASLARTPGSAAAVAQQSAARTLAGQQLTCSQLTVTVDPAAFAVPVGTTGTVAVHLTCRVALGDVAVAGVPGSTTMTAGYAAPLDPYRAR